MKHIYSIFFYRLLGFTAFVQYVNEDFNKLKAMADTAEMESYTLK